MPQRCKTPPVGQEGLTIVASVCMLLALTALGAYVMQSGGYEAESAKRREVRLAAFWKAEEALSKARMDLQSFNGDPNGRQFEIRRPGDSLCAYYSIRRTGAQYTCSATVYRALDPGRETILSLFSVEKPKPLTDYFMIFDEKGEPWFDTGDTIDGDIHTNSIFRIRGNPFFNDSAKLTYSGDEPGYENPALVRTTPLSRRPVFDSAIDFSHMADSIRRVPHIVVPFYKVAQLTFLPNGKYELRYRDVTNPLLMSPPEIISIRPDTGLYFEGDVEVKGTLNGRITIGSSADITITDDLIYAGSNPTNGDPTYSKSLLALIAEKNVFVNQDQSPMEFGKGIIINANIVAMDKSFEVVNFRKWRKSMGTMFFWGSMAQSERGAVGSYRKKGNIVRGYRKSWHMDPRFKNETTLVDPLRYVPIMKTKSGKMKFATKLWSRPGV